MNDHPSFYLGGQRGLSRSEQLLLRPDKLCTHGVILGMTGSGKTGLGVVLLEEAARCGIPSLVIDPKGDLGTLQLNFAGQGHNAFSGWIPPGAGAETPQEVHARYVAGTGGWGLDFDGDPSLRQRPVRVLTPGNAQLRPVNLLGSLKAPGGEGDDEREALISGLLALLGLDADPFTSRPYLMLSALVQHSWGQGKDLSWLELLRQLETPPVRKLGVFPVDEFYPIAERRELAARLNGLLASPRFAAWAAGEALDFESLFDAKSPKCTVMYLAHLDESERQFVVSLLLGKLVQWMRAQAGSQSLRALIYMDEVAGYAPPTAAPPTKRPLMTLFKQARAYGVGLVLSTQNPVDLDYKALSNAGTWLVGRLQTEQDRARVVGGLSQHAIDRQALETTLASLPKRHFVTYQSSRPQPRTIEVRHALSYLRGPLTLAELAKLPQSVAEAGASATETVAAPAEPSEAAAQGSSTPGGLATGVPAPGLPLMPKVASGVAVRYLSESAPWARELGIDFSSRTLQAGLAARVQLRFDERRAGLDHTLEWEAVWFPLASEPSAGQAQRVDYDDRDWLERPPEPVVYDEGTRPLSERTLFTQLKRELIGELHANQQLELWHHPELKLFGRPGETRSDFSARAQAAANEQADAETARLRAKYERKLERLRERQRAAERRHQQLTSRASAEQQQEWLSGATSLLSLFLGGKASTSGLRRAARNRARTSGAKQRAAHQAEKVEELELAAEDLAQELEDEVTNIADRWDAVSQHFGTLAVSLEKNDIRVAELIVFWAPGLSRSVRSPASAMSPQ